MSSKLQVRGQGVGSDLRSRTVVATPVAILAVLMISQGGLLFAVGVAAIGLLALHEFYRMIESLQPVRLAGIVTLLGSITAAYYGGPQEVLLLAVVALPVTFLLATVSESHSQLSLRVTFTLLGTWWIAVAFAHAVLLRELDHGGGVMIAALIGTFLGDTGAYLGGKLFGSKRLAPRLSPNKTVEGLVAGALTSILAVWFAGLYMDWLTGTDALLIGLLVAVVAPIGDLFESALKRDFEVKDTGSILGPHGGVLDRVDAALFAVVATYYLWSYLL